MIASFLIAFDFFVKIAAVWGVFGKSEVNKYAIGVGMIPRGEVGLVFAGVGAASGALPESLDAAIIVMVIVTTFIAPLWLRSAFQGAEEATAVLEEEPASLSDLKDAVIERDAAASQPVAEMVELPAKEAEQS